MPKTDTLNDRPAQLIVLAAIFFNFILSICNQNFFSITSNIVITCQIVITSMALFLSLWRSEFSIPKPMFFAIIWIFLCLSLSAWINTGISFKNIYDMLLIPIFILLGIRSRMPGLKFFIVVGGIVGVVAVWEAFSPGSYISIVNPQGYLRNTREWIAESTEAFGNTPSLYLGSNRSGGSFFGLTSHRLGSTFLEPLSLGYFATLLLIAAYPLIGRDKFKWLSLTFLCALLALGADSRFSFITICILYTLSLVARHRFPNATPLGALTIFTIALVIYTTGAFSEVIGDDITYRLSITFDEVARSFPGAIFGAVSIDRAGDSGVLTMIRSVGIIGLPALLLLCAGWYTPGWKAVGYLPLAVTIYFVGASMLGGATLSIKTAALLGYVIGAVARQKQAELSQYMIASERVGTTANSLNSRAV